MTDLLGGLMADKQRQNANAGPWAALRMTVVWVS